MQGIPDTSGCETPFDSELLELIAVAFCHFKNCITENVSCDTAIDYVPTDEEAIEMIQADPVLRDFIHILYSTIKSMIVATALKNATDKRMLN